MTYCHFATVHQTRGEGRLVQGLGELENFRNQVDVPAQSIKCQTISNLQTCDTGKRLASAYLACLAGDVASVPRERALGASGGPGRTTV